MSTAAPPVDPRDAAAVHQELIEQLQARVPGWTPTDPKTGEPNQASAALIEVFTRFCAIVIDRLNRAPDKNFLAYLDLLGVAPVPPQPARAPLTFTLSTGSLVDAVVPAGTQVAAPPAEGERDPVVFETERELTVVAATLQTLLAVDPSRDLVADHTALVANPVETGLTIFGGEQPSDNLTRHFLYVGHPSLALEGIDRVEVDLQADGVDDPQASGLSPQELFWEAWNGTKWQFVEDVIRPPQLFTGLYAFPRHRPIPPLTIAGITSSWMRCKSVKMISPASTPVFNMISGGLIPALAAINVRLRTDRFQVAPDAVFANEAAVDVTRPFHPFGERPKLGDVLYVGSQLGFGHPNTEVVLNCEVAFPVPPPNPPSELLALKLRWEIWNGVEWSLLGESSVAGAIGDDLVDGTRALTATGMQHVSFKVPEHVAPTAVNGVTSHWIRVRIAAGDYGVDARYVPDGDEPGGFRLEPATFAPPVLTVFNMTYSMQSAEWKPAAALAQTHEDFEDIGSRIAVGTPQQPFRALPNEPPALYVAFALPAGRKAFPARPVTLYHSLRPLEYGEHAKPLHPERGIRSANAGSTLIHQFTLTNTSEQRETFLLTAVGGTWHKDVSPSEVSLDPGVTAPIAVSVTVPPQANLPGPNASDTGFLVAGRFLPPFTPPARFAFSSAVIETRVGEIAARRRNVRWEYWNGKTWRALAVADETDGLTHSGVLEFFGPADLVQARQFGIGGYWLRAQIETGDEGVRPRLRTLVPNTIPALQATTFRDEVLGSSDGSEQQVFRTFRSPVLAGAELEVRESQAWVRWLEVTDFHGSTSADRHYVLDHTTGQVRFGDGVRGRIPPRGAGNIRMARYQTGGGSQGNRAAGTLVQMKTSVPFVDAVSNPEAAQGGFAAESIAGLIARGPRQVRHGGRAVTCEDYEDAARLASPEVARVKCVPLRKLQGDPLGQTTEPGAVSLIIVPGATEPAPRPSVELLERVERFLEERQAASAEVEIVGPLYVRVDVEIDVALIRFEGASRIEQAIREVLAAFLHPLTGGRDGTGWDFGREPHASDLHAVVSGVPGVDHVRRLELTQIEDTPRARETGRFLVYSGQHRIQLEFLGAQ